MLKSTLRKTLIDRRLSMSTEEIDRKSRIIQLRLLETPLYGESGVIALYSSFRGEVKTDLIMNRAAGDGKTVVLPRIDWRDFSMEFVAVTGKSGIVERADGFREPAPGEGEVVPVKNIDLFVVPGVAYDLKGNRLGMGKGCYDRALSAVDRDRIVAPAYEFQLVECVPVCSHDVSVGWIVTENRILEC